MATTTESPPTASPPAIGGMYAACGFSPLPASVPLCRQWLSERLQRLHIHSAVAGLVVSELTANAVKHTQAEFELRCYRPRNGALCVEVRDWDPRPPIFRRAGIYDEGGRGLALVDAYTLCWGWEPLPQGKRVYAYVEVAA